MSRLPLTQGQVWTISLGTALAAVLLATSMPAVLSHRTAPGVVAQAAPATLPPTTPDAHLQGPGQSPPSASPAAPPALPAPPALIAGPQQSVASSPPPGSQSAPSPPESQGQTSAPPAATIPLAIRGGGFSSTDPDAVASAGVPPDGYPVSVRAGSVVDTSYVRLTGSGTVLILAISAATGATTGPDSLALKACRITTADWTAARPGAAVPYDPSDCALSSVLADGRLSIELSAYPERTGAMGFALVADLSRDSTPSTRTARLVVTGAQP